MKNVHSDDTFYSSIKVADGYKDASRRTTFAFHRSEIISRLEMRGQREYFD